MRTGAVLLTLDGDVRKRLALELPEIRTRGPGDLPAP